MRPLRLKDDAPSVDVGVLVGIDRGDYSALGDAHEAVDRFAAARGLELAGPRWEIYGHGHIDPSELTTEVHYLLS